MGGRGEAPLGASGRLKGPAGLSPRSLARKNTLDEMTVGRTEVPLGGPKPQKPSSPQRGEVESRRSREPGEGPPGLLARGQIGAGSYEDPAEERRRKGRPKKTGRPRH
jgi:excinuclease ABC subunit B